MIPTIETFITEWLNKQPASVKVQFTKIDNEGDKALFSGIKELIKIHCIEQAKIIYKKVRKVNYEDLEDTILNAYDLNNIK